MALAAAIHTPMIQGASMPPVPMMLSFLMTTATDVAGSVASPSAAGITDWSLIVKLKEWSVLYGLRLLAAVLILIGGRIVAGLLRRMLRAVLVRGRIEQTLISFISNLVSTVTMVFAFIFAISTLGVQTASIIAVIGAAGLAVGLALQGSLSNFAAGVLIIFFKPFKVGDLIEGGGRIGTVTDIGIFTTLLTMPDNCTVVVPNSKMTSDNVINHSANPTRRIDLVVRVPSGTAIARAKTELAAALAAEPRVLPEPAPVIGVLELTGDGIRFAVRPWVKTADYWPAWFALQEAIRLRLEAAGMVAP
jgi:small conductance mechanosensitive channel